MEEGGGVATMEDKVCDLLGKIKNELKNEVMAENPPSEVTINIGGIEVIVLIEPKGGSIDIKIKKWYGDRESNAFKRGARLKFGIDELPKIKEGAEYPNFCLERNPEECPKPARPTSWPSSELT
jgi:hypothetical protein